MTVCYECKLREGDCECHLWALCYRCGAEIEKIVSDYVDQHYYCTECSVISPENED